MHILFAGGGTAGHINPAIAVAGYIKKVDPDCKISFVGTKRGLESRLVPLEGYDFYTIDVAGFQRKITVKNVFRNISAVCKVVTSSFASKKLLKTLKPDVVVGTGGYVCGPVLREAAKMGIKTAVHEANAYPGVTIKMLAPLVDVVMIAMEDAKDKLNCKNPPIITGNPIRQGLTSLNRDEARKKLGVPVDANVVLSFGGSLGAKIINESMFEVIKWNSENKKYYCFNGTGRLGYSDFISRLNNAQIDTNSKYVNVYEYIDNMDVLLAAADVVVCRAGAMTVNELQVCGKPAILIPSPYVAENHQFHNAMSLKKIGAAELIEEKDLNGEVLIKVLNAMFSDKKELKVMSKRAKESAVVDADRRIAEIIFNL
jgi:UDP-N-acetylglucosamine--N-acetylmuramyl-(pentapeptide) pyrophosphoryl-undecaprenol N-acetylglucosamine transferase